MPLLTLRDVIDIKASSHTSVMHFLVVRLGAGDHGGRVGEERRDLPRVIVGVVGKLDAIRLWAQ
eukprot:7184486-Pyramimonas_sp.AAC.1